MSSASPHRFRFRPRFRALAAGAVLLGIALFGLASLVDTGRVFLLAGGGVGALIGLVYLGSPAWRFVVAVDDDALAVTSGKRERFRLLWSEVREVVASPSTHTCYVNGGSPRRSLLVPGPGASALYDIENKRALYDLICARVPAERVREVELLERAESSPGSGRGDSGDASAADGGEPAARDDGGAER
ncbi:MAG: hypothetical protein AAGC55_32270 [Myxococcota bacterium]